MREITALAPWFGSNRLLAENVGRLLEGRSWVGVPFAGGMCELAHIGASSIVVGDLHRHLVNLARTVQDDQLRPALVRQLRRAAFHPDELDDVQEWCKAHEPARSPKPDLQAAYAYFVCVWMGRSSIAGTADEFHGRLSTRWNANGGDSNKRFRSAVRSLAGWSVVMRRCQFSVMDAFDFLARCEDTAGHGIYADPPFPRAGRVYRHNAGQDDAAERDWHVRLRDALARFASTRVVCRFYDHPLIRELYPEPRWHWNLLRGRKQSNEAAPEVLLVNGPPAGAGGLF